jgi:hypothetical protein
MFEKPAARGTRGRDARAGQPVLSVGEDAEMALKGPAADGLLVRPGERLLRMAGRLALIGLAMALLALPLLHRGAGVPPANCGRLHAGMTQAEVEAVLGCPQGKYLTRPYPYHTFSLQMPAGAARVEVWAVVQGEVYVGFDASGRVTEFYCCVSDPDGEEEGLLGRLCRLLPW